MTAAIFHRTVGQKESLVFGTLRSLGMTTSTDNVRWSVVGPLIAGGVVALVVVVWTIAVSAGGVQESVKNLSESVKIMSNDVAGIREQLHVQASAITRLEDQFHYNSQHVDAQDRELSDIKTQLSSLREQVEHVEQPHSPQVRRMPP